MPSEFCLSVSVPNGRGHGDAKRHGGQHLGKRGALGHGTWVVRGRRSPVGGAPFGQGAKRARRFAHPGAGRRVQRRLGQTRRECVATGNCAKHAEKIPTSGTRGTHKRCPRAIHRRTRTGAEVSAPWHFCGRLGVARFRRSTGRGGGHPTRGGLQNRKGRGQGASPERRLDRPTRKRRQIEGIAIGGLCHDGFGHTQS